MIKVRSKHPKKEIEAALVYAESQGWTVVPRSGHAWGQLRCPNNSKSCRGGVFCMAGVWSTPTSPATHAKQIIQYVDNCTMKKKK